MNEQAFEELSFQAVRQLKEELKLTLKSMENTKNKQELDKLYLKATIEYPVWFKSQVDQVYNKVLNQNTNYWHYKNIIETAPNKEYLKSIGYSLKLVVSNMQDSQVIKLRTAYIKRLREL